jgi:uncharacterized protein
MKPSSTDARGHANSHEHATAPPVQPAQFYGMDTRRTVAGRPQQVGRGRSAPAAALLLGFFLAAPLAAQEPPPSADRPADPVVIGEAITLRSDLLGEDRRVLIHLPAGYDRSTERYPVLYLLDGSSGHFHHVTGITRFLAHADRIPPMIVVGIANTDRDRDLKPAARTTRHTEELVPFGGTITTDAPTAGGADRFLQFLVEELAQHIESRYRTADFRLLVGHSAGGLFALHALLQRPAAFHAVVASSPALWWDDAALVKRAAADGLPDFGPRGRFLYMAVGDEGGEISDFASILEIADPPGLRWWYRLMPGESHASVPHRAIYDGLETIFADYATSETLVLAGDVTRVERRFADASRIYGYEIPPPERLIEAMGEVQLHLFGRPDRAVEIFRRYVELYPTSADAQDNLADALEAAGRVEEAREHRERANAARPAGAPTLLERGDSLMALGRFDEAIGVYERATAYRPEGEAADPRLFRAWLALGLADQAEAALARARQQGEPAPYRGWWHCRRALIAIFAGDRNALASQTDSLVAVASDEAPRSFECAAFNEVFLRRYDDARAHLQRYVALERPDEFPVNLGFLHLLRGDTAQGKRILEAAEARARAALEEEPASWEPYFELAELAAMRRRTDEALRHLEAAVERGLGREWWTFHLFSPDALPDPVFELLYTEPEFERLRDRVLAARRRETRL